MSVNARIRSRSRAAAGALALAGLLAGCGSSVGLGLPSSSSGSGGASSSGMHATSSGTSMGVSMGASSSSSTGMSMNGSSVTGATVPEVNGIKPVASRVLATAYWQGMEIQARTTTPTSFVVYDGSGKERMFKANRHMSFHLMVMLSDRHTGVQIPYASVWARITSSKGKVVFNEAQWPMISAYMGSHYGNNVTLPGPGRYTLELLISPPVVARHLEYAHVWQVKHKVTASFTWKPAE